MDLALKVAQRRRQVPVTGRWRSATAFLAEFHSRFFSVVTGSQFFFFVSSFPTRFVGNPARAYWCSKGRLPQLRLVRPQNTDQTSKEASPAVSGVCV